MFAAPKELLPGQIPQPGNGHGSAAPGHAPVGGLPSARHRVRKHMTTGALLLARSPRRRVWVSRGVLLLILAMQAALTLRMANTAFEDEALYLYVGHMEIGHFLHGAALQGDYPSYFSGSPVLYPVLGALADSIGGLAAARALSLLEMLASTSLVYATSRRLFNERVGLCAAVIYAGSEPTLFLGRLATYDATALTLLALATWLVVRNAGGRRPAYLLAAPVLAVAVATKYATLLFVPSVIVLAGLAAAPRIGRRALSTSVVLAATTATLLVGMLYVAGPDYITGFKFTTLNRFLGHSSTTSLLWDCAQWIGLPLVLAIIGAVGYALRPFIELGEKMAPDGGRRRRILLGVLMTFSALLAPIEQIRIHTEVSLFKHVGFGLVLAAPIVGFGLAHVIGDHFRRAQVGIAIWGAALVIGMTSANNLFNVWPNSTVLVADMSHYLQPGARYLVEVDEVPIYYLRGHADAQPRQFTSTYFIGYQAKTGQYLTGDAGYVAAIKDDYFRMVAFNYQTTPAVDSVLERALAANPDYRLAAVIPNGNDTVRQYLWVRSK